MRLFQFRFSAFFLLVSVCIGADLVSATETRERFLSAFRASAAPPGFATVCDRYEWACSRAWAEHAGGGDLRIAARINVAANRQIRGATDMRTYGRVDYWALPTRGRGDCEDIALLKKKQLIEAGFSPKHLLLALVIHDVPQTHVVLVLRTSHGDFVLDSNTPRLLRWDQSGLTFLKMQNDNDPRRWDTILLGPLASRR